MRTKRQHVLRKSRLLPCADIDGKSPFPQQKKVWLAGGRQRYSQGSGSRTDSSAEATLLRMRQAKSLGCIHSRRRPRGLLIVRRARSSGRRPLCHAAAPIPAQMPCARRCSRRVGARKLWLRFAGRASEDTRCGLPPSPRSQGHSGGLLRSLRPARHRQLAAVAQPPPGTKTNDALPESTP